MFKKHNNFKFSTKANNIYQLSKIPIKFKIPQLIYFSFKEWKKNRNNLVRNIKKNLKSEYIIIRSSSLEEDSKKISNAGKYLSINNIETNQIGKIILNVNRVFKSYGNLRSNNQVIVQESIKNISMSGVVFTHELENGAPYYAINYDDQTFLTDTVTSGTSEYSNRTLYIYRNQKNQLKSKRFKKLIECIKDLELRLNSKYLDIEFGITKNLKCFLFQVRPITVIKNKDKNLEKYFENAFKNKKKKTIFFY